MTDFNKDAKFFFVLDKTGGYLRKTKITASQLDAVSGDTKKSFVESGYVHSTEDKKTPSTWRVRFADFVKGKFVAEDSSVAIEPEEKALPAKAKDEVEEPKPEPVPSKTAPYSTASTEAKADAIAKAEVKVVVPASTEAPPVVTAPIPAAPTKESEEDCECLCEEEVQRLIDSSMDSFRKKLNEKESNWSSGLEQRIREGVERQVEDLLQKASPAGATINEAAIAALVADEVKKALANQPKPSIDSSALEAAVKPIAGKAVDEALSRKAWANGGGGNGGGGNVHFPSRMDHNHSHNFVMPWWLIWLVGGVLATLVALTLAFGFFWKPEVKVGVSGVPDVIRHQVPAMEHKVSAPVEIKGSVNGRVEVNGNVTVTAPTVAPSPAMPKVQQCPEGMAKCMQKASKEGLNKANQRLFCISEGCNK